MEIGVYTFAEMTPDPYTGKTIPAHQRLSNLMEEIELAEQVGLDVFAVGEHHRPDYAVSSPAVILAAAAVKTKTEILLDDRKRYAFAITKGWFFSYMTKRAVGHSHEYLHKRN